MPNQKMPNMGVAPRQASVRHPHDLGGSRIYSQPLGMMLPVFHQTLNPREVVDLSVISNTQMMTLKGRAFTSFRQRFAAFFVKNTDMWSFWQSFITNIPLNNTLSSTKMVYPSTSSATPNVSSGYALPSDSQNYNILPASAPNANVFETCHILMEQYYLRSLAGLGAFSSSNTFAAQVWADLACWITNLPTFTGATFASSQTDPSNFVHPSDAFGYPLGPSACRLAEFLGFGCVNPQNIITKYLYDFYISYMSSQTEAKAFYDANSGIFATISSSTQCLSVNQTDVLFDVGGYVTQGFSSGLLRPAANLRRKRNIFKLISYQKVYSDYFRQNDFEPIEPLISNVDFFFNSNTLDTDLSIDWPTLIAQDIRFFFNPLNLSNQQYTLLKLLTPRYAHFGLDVLTNVKPSPMYTFATPSLPSDILGQFGGFFKNTSIDTNAGGNYGSPAGGSGLGIQGYSTLTQFQTNNVGLGLSSGQPVTPQSLRALFALEKIAKLSASSRRTYYDQIRSVFGVSPSVDSHTAILVGSAVGNANVVPVIATADGTTSDSSTNFGQQGSYVDGQCKGSLCNKFTAPDFGELIVFTWLECNAPFDSNFVDPMVSKLYPSDFFHPQFANLGMQPLMTEIIDQNYINCIGFQPRYSEYKTGRDIVFGDFQTERNKSFMTTHRLNYEDLRLSPFNDVFRDNENNPIENYPNSTKFSFVRLFMISPAITDALCEIKYDGTTQTDCTDVYSNFNCTIIRDMNENGEPLI